MKVDNIEVSYEEMLDAFERICRLQGHYANLLNQYDGGQRLQLSSPTLAIQRMRFMKEKVKNETPS